MKMIKYVIIILLTTSSLYANTKKIDSYLNIWLKDKDSVLMFNYKTGKILYEYHSYMFDKKIPIGSIFKIVTTFLFLKEYPKRSESYRYFCSPKLDRNLYCWNKKGHGIMDLKSAFIHSCNKYYYSLDLSIKKINEISIYLGLKIFIPNNLLPKENKLIMAGNLPSIKASFYDLSKLLSVFANKGKIISIKDEKDIRYVREIKIIDKIRKLMYEVIQKGTAKRVLFKGYKLSGKTGTEKNENGKLNGIFIGFTVDKPYAIIVNIYNNIGSTSAKIASDIIYIYSKL